MVLLFLWTQEIAREEMQQHVILYALFYTPQISEYKCLLERNRLFMFLHYVTSISVLEIELLAGTCANISSPLFMSSFIHI